jgi:hypothetical protein
MVGVV